MTEPDARQEVQQKSQEPLSGASTPDQKLMGLDQQQTRSPQRRPVLPAPADMFALSSSAMIETPDRGQLVTGTNVGQRKSPTSHIASTVPLKQISATGHSRAANIQCHVAGKSVVHSPQNSSGQMPIYQNLRVGEANIDPQQQQQSGRTTLVPNFRSISPSIFNIDLNQTVVKGEPSTVAPGSPGAQSSSNRNQIYVSIHQSKRNEAEAGGHVSHRVSGSGPNFSQSMRVRRIGPLKNKGEKIKFGVLVSRETKKKAQQQQVDFLQPHEIFETQKQLMNQGSVAIGKHSKDVARVMDQYRTYTTTKTLPSVLVSRHTNVLKQFNKNFTRETDTYSRHSYNMASRLGSTSAGGAGGLPAGYHTDSESLQQNLHDLNRKHHVTANRPKSKHSFWTDDKNLMSIRDVIEEHARSVAAIKKSTNGLGGPNAYLEIDAQRKRRNRQLEERGREIASDLNLSTQSCCTRASRFYRSLTSKQPIRQHNKPLTHLMSSNQKQMAQRKQQTAHENRKRLIQAKQQLKQRMMGLSLSAMQNDFKAGVSQVSRGTHLRKETLAIMKEEEDKYKNRMRARRSKDDWDQQRKDVEDKIDQGHTFSHLSRKFPMKREWSKYLVLLKKKELDRRLKERKIRELVEDLNERGVVDDKQIANEVDLFEYQENKKKRDKSKARLGQAAAKYYRPVDTEKTLQIEAISMDMTDDYDDGPGGFKLEDFEGVETMFSKQSLEQRKLRVDKARERLRLRRIQKLNEARIESRKELQHSASQAEVGDSQLSVTEQANQQDEPELTQSRVMPKINIDDQRQQRQPNDSRYYHTRAKRVSEQMPSQIYGQLNQTNNLKHNDGNRTPIQTIHSSEKKNAFRVQIASGRNTDKRQIDTLKTTSHNRDYSLEDGGIFEKKTHQQDASVAQSNLLGESITQGSLEILQAQKHETNTSSEELVAGVHSPHKSPNYIRGGEQSLNASSNLTQGSKQHRNLIEEDGDRKDRIDQESQLIIQDGNAEIQQQEGNNAMPMYTTTGVTKIGEFLQQPRIRPSTTDNVRRIVMNRRRQLMSGYNKPVQNMRESMPEDQNRARFGRYNKAAETQKSAAIITTVQQQQRKLKPNAAQYLVNQSSSLAKHMLKHTMPHEGTTCTGDGSDARPSRAMFSVSGVPKGGIITIRNSGQEKNFGYGGQTTTGALTYTQSGPDLTRQMTSPTIKMDNWRSDHKKIIWKEILKAKEDQNLDGSTRTSRQLVRSIRNRIRKQRHRAQKESFGSHSLLMRDKPMSEESGLRTKAQHLRMQRHNQQNTGETPIKKYNALPDFVTKAASMPELTDRYNAQITKENQDHVKPKLIQVQGQNNIAAALGLNATNQNYTAQFNDSQTGTVISYDDAGGTTAQEDQNTSAGFAKEQKSQNGIALMDNNLQHSVRQQAPEFVLGPLPPLQMPKGGQRDASYMSQVNREQRGLETYSSRKNFVSFNRSCVRENSLKLRLGRQNLSRLPKMRGMRPREALYQSRLQDNMTRSAMQFNQKTNLGMRRTKMGSNPLSIEQLKSQAKLYAAKAYATSQSTANLFPPFQEQILDRRSMQVFRQNVLQVDPDIDNEFTRQEAWNQTHNCPYYGLLSLRQTQDMAINSDTREENILLPFTTGNKQDRQHIFKVKSAIHHRNKLREMDKKVYNLIEACQESKKIQWKQIYDQNEEFRNTQRKKIQEPEPLQLDDLIELVKI